MNPLCECQPRIILSFINRFSDSHLPRCSCFACSQPGESENRQEKYLVVSTSPRELEYFETCWLSLR